MPRRVHPDRVAAALALFACLLALVGVPTSGGLRASPMGDTAAATARAQMPAGPLSVLVRSAGKPARPLPGARLRAYWAEGKRHHLMAVNRTGDKGRATLEGLPRGVIWLLIDAPGHARASARWVLSESGRHIEVTLEPAHRLSVRVVDEAGKPIVDATVLVTATDVLPFGALTDAHGQATFTELPAAPWRVRVAARGYEAVTRADVMSDLTVTLRKLGALDIFVRDGQGRDVAGATVLIAGSSLWPARRAETNEKGRALISGLEAGIYDIKALRGNLVSKAPVTVELDRGERERVELVLVPGRMVTAIVTDGEDDHPILVSNADVVLVESGLSSFPIQGRTNTFGEVTLGPIPPGPAVLGARADGFVARTAVPVPEPLEGPVQIPLLRGGTLRGEVVDGHGHPVDGATIEVIGTDTDGMPIAENPMLSAFQQMHFEWALPGPRPLIPAGELGVMPGPIPPIPMGPTTSIGPSAVPLEVTAPLPEPWVTRWDGRFEAKPITPGRVRALVRHPDYVEGLSEAVSLAPGGEAKVRVVLTSGGALEGRVVDASGLPVAGARVDVSAVVGTVERTTLSASDGTFAFAALPSEVVLSLARPDDLARIVLRRPVRVAEGKSEEIEVVLPAPRAAMRVEVTNGEDRRPVALAQVTALSLAPDSPLRFTAFTDDEGAVSIEDCAGLPLRLTVEAPGFARAQQQLGAAPEELDVVLVRGVLVEGHVTAVRGREPVVSAQVTLVGQGRRHVTYTDLDGLYRFSDVSEGRALLTVSAQGYAESEVTVFIKNTGRSDRAFEVDAIDLVEPGIIKGVVLDTAQRPVHGARVAIDFAPAFLPLGALPPGMTRTDRKGRFELAGVRPGAVTLEAYAPGVGRGRARGVRVESGLAVEGVTLVLNEPEQATEPAAAASVAVTLGERGDELFDIVVIHVAPNSEAEHSGMAVGDIVLSIDGVEPETMQEARTRLSGREGSDVVVALERRGRRVSVRVRRERVRQ